MGTTSNIVIGLQTTNTMKIGNYGDAEAAAVDVGFIKGGAEINHELEQYDIKVDQALGPVAVQATDENMTIKITLSEATLANVCAAYGYPTTAVADSTFTFGDVAANTYRTLYINVKSPNAGSRKYTFHKAIPTGSITYSHKKDEETLLEISFKILCDTTKTAAARFGTIVDTGADTTPPTVALSTPVDGGTVTKDAKGTVVWTITEANPLNENTIIYGNTFSIINTTTPGSAALVAGTIAYSSTAKTVTFTPTENWTASDTFQAIVTTGLEDANGNALAAIKIEQFSATA